MTALAPPPVAVTSSSAGGRSRSVSWMVWPALVMFPLGFALLFLQAISELIKRIEAMAGEIELDTTYEKPVQ